MRLLIKYVFDYTNKNSLAYYFRKKRYKIYTDMINHINKKYSCINILDVGGTTTFWEKIGIDNKNYNITILNLEKEEQIYSNIVSVIGDGRHMPQYKNNEFDLVFSNSVIEHVGDIVKQKKMAEEIIRVGKSYIIQTPNYYFPIEPHFMFPAFQWLNLNIKIWLLMKLPLGFSQKKIDNIEKANTVASSIHLLRIKDMQYLFPDSEIIKEKLFGMTKSIIAYKLLQINGRRNCNNPQREALHRSTSSIGICSMDNNVSPKKSMEVFNYEIPFN